MKVTYFYDYTCPHCYIGSKRLQTLSKEFDLDVKWVGIEIHPEFPPEGLKKRNKSLKSKTFTKTIRQISTDDNRELKLPGFVTNSRLSLEASEYAKTRDRFLEYHNGIYEAYFQQARNIGDKSIILDVGTNSGLDREELKDVLETRSMFNKIKGNNLLAEQHSVLGVPTFLFGEFPLHGNQSTETLRSIISRSIDRSQK